MHNLRFTCTFKKRFWGIFFSKKHDFKFKIFLKKACFWRKKFLLKAWFWIKNFSSGHISNHLFYNMSDFSIKILQFVGFWINFLNTRQISNEYFSTCQFLSVLLLQQAKFSCVHHNRPRSCTVLRYGVGSVSQVILSGYAVRTPTVTNVTKRFKTANLIRVCSLIYVDKE